MVSPIASVEDLAAQSSIEYGLYASGSTATFFRSAQRRVNVKWHGRAGEQHVTNGTAGVNESDTFSACR